MKRLLFLLGVLLTAHPALAQEHAQPTREGKMVRRVAAPYLDLRMAALSADGRYLSYVEWDSANLALHDLTTGENRNLTNDGSWSEPPQFAYFSTISPDGK